MKHQTYDKAFKEHAVTLWLGSGKSAQAVAAELGIKRDRLYIWKQQLEQTTAGKPARNPTSPEQLQREVARLQLENQRLRQQRDILKKTLGILSEPLSSDTSASKP
jgi:transposase